MVIEPVKSNYGDAVNINYVDINEDGLSDEVKKIVHTYNLPYPVTFINGEAVSAGYISYYDLASKLDQLFKAE